MTTNWSILEGLKTALRDDLPNYFDGLGGDDVLFPLADKQVVIDEYDIDNLPANVSVFLVAGYEDNERDTMQSDQATFSAELYCICKGLKRADLVKQAQLYKASIERLIGNDETLGGLVDFVRVVSSNFYQGVDSLGVAKGFRLDLEFIYHKVFA